MKKCILSILIIVSINTNAQQNNTQAAIYNIGLGGLTGSIGAALNKKPNEKLGKVMLKGFWQGAFGGTVVYGSKQMVYAFDRKNDPKNLWMSKLVNSVGISMIENAALNTNFYEKWHINIGFNRLELDFKNNFKAHYKVSPVALFGFIGAANNGKFNLKYSLQTLTPIFLNNDKNKTTTLVNSIITKERNGSLYAIRHEYIHTLQYDDYMSINVFFNTQKNKWKNKNKYVDKYTKWIFMDLPGALTLRSFYLLENINQNCYFDNFYEGEANFYSDKHKCP